MELIFWGVFFLKNDKVYDKVCKLSNDKSSLKNKVNNVF